VARTVWIVHERTFDNEPPSDSPADFRSGATVRAVELAERVLEEASSARQDWASVALAAAELARLARRLSEVCERGD
jgi:hypothetical protein